MAFSRSTLALMAPGPFNSLWCYRTADAAAAVDSAGYFNLAAADLRVGDIIFLHAGFGGTPAYGAVVVNANDGAVVDIGDLTNFASADTD